MRPNRLNECIRSPVLQSVSGFREMKKEKEYFDLQIEELQSLGLWAADCAERVLWIFEEIERDDRRPRNALEGIREFADSGKRSNRLRKLAMDAYRASRETENPAASAAAQSAGLAAASAFTHPFKDIYQSRHILGPAVYSALALELRHGGNPAVGNEVIREAISCVNRKTAELLGKMPEQKPGKKRTGQLFYDLDCGIRNELKSRF